MTISKDYTRPAKRLVHEWYRCHGEFPTKKAEAIAAARFEGFCEGLSAAALGATHTAILLDCLDAINRTLYEIGPRSEPNLGADHSSQRLWDEQAMRYIVERWTGEV